MIKDFIHYYKPYKKLFLLDFTCAMMAILELATNNGEKCYRYGYRLKFTTNYTREVGFCAVCPSRHLNFIVVYMGAYFRD